MFQHEYAQLSRYVNLEQYAQAIPYSVRDSYKQSDLFYRIFNNVFNFRHVGLTDKKHLTVNSYTRQLHEIEALLRMYGAKSVLEVGCGNGSSLRYLARRNPGVKFLGTTNSISGKPKDDNYTIYASELEDIPEGEYDVIYAVESLCHCKDIHRTVVKLLSNLRSGGLLIIFDMYSTNSVYQMSSKDYTVYSALVAGIGLHGYYNSSVLDAIPNGHHFISVDDTHLTKAFTKRLRLLAEMYFSHRRCSSNYIDNHFHSALVGYLLDPLCEKGILQYRVDVFVKKQTG